LRVIQSTRDPAKELVDLLVVMILTTRNWSTSCPEGAGDTQEPASSPAQEEVVAVGPASAASNTATTGTIPSSEAVPPTPTPHADVAVAVGLQSVVPDTSTATSAPNGGIATQLTDEAGLCQSQPPTNLLTTISVTVWLPIPDAAGKTVFIPCKPSLANSLSSVTNATCVVEPSLPQSVASTPQHTAPTENAPSLESSEAPYDWEEIEDAVHMEEWAREVDRWRGREEDYNPQ
jgi:hypothetical protein